MQEFLLNLISNNIILFHSIIIGIALLSGIVGYQFKKINIFEKLLEIKITVKTLKKVAIWIVLIVIAIIFISTILGVIYLFFWGDIGNNKDKLGVLVSLLSPFLTFLGAYSLFIFGNKYNKKQEQLIEIKERQQSFTNINNCIVDSISKMHQSVDKINYEYEKVFTEEFTQTLKDSKVFEKCDKKEIFEKIYNDKEIFFNKDEVQNLKANESYDLLINFKQFTDNEINSVKVYLLETIDWKSDLRVVTDKTYHDEAYIFLDAIENKSFKNTYRFLLSRDNCIVFLDNLNRIDILNIKNARKLPSSVILKKFFQVDLTKER